MRNQLLFIPLFLAATTACESAATTNENFAGYYRGILELQEDTCSLGVPRRMDIDFSVAQVGQSVSVELPNGETMEGVARSDSFTVTTTYPGSNGLTIVTTSLIADEVTPTDAFVTREFSTRSTLDGSECLVVNTGYVIRESE